MPDSTETPRPLTQKSNISFIVITLIVVGVLTIFLWVVAGWNSLHMFVLFLSLSLASFVAGCFLGFLISSFGEESATVGKIRDWLVGGTSALTLANIGPIKDFLVNLGKAGGIGPGDTAITLSICLLNFGIGFFFMYFSRVLFLNISQAKSVAEREKLEGSQEASKVIQQFLLKLPANMLTGVKFVGEIEDLSEKEKADLKESLNAKEIGNFLDQCETAAKEGRLDWDSVAKAAYIYYYRTYFTDTEHPIPSIDKAIEWLTRALNMNPNHVELTMKYAEMMAAKDNYDSAVMILERLATRPEAPMLVLQWLGYYLRSVDGRMDDSIDYSLRYLATAPNDMDAISNLAYAYGHKYCDELQTPGASDDPNSQTRKDFLLNTKRLLIAQPKWKKQIKDNWFKSGTGLECLKGDKDLIAILQSIADPTPVASAQGSQS